MEEELADLMHQIWSDWINYMVGVGYHKVELPGELIIPKEYLNRWIRQAVTPYHKLSEEERESDRELARKILHFIESKTASKKDLIKADWSEAPEWAQYRTIDPDGLTIWWELKPRVEGAMWFSEMKDDGKFGKHIILPPGIDWRETLEKRPETD